MKKVKEINRKEGNELIANFSTSKHPLAVPAYWLASYTDFFKWENLMPVLDIIEHMNCTVDVHLERNIGGEPIGYSARVDIHDWWCLGKERFEFRDAETREEATYQAICQFIKWFDKKGKPQYLKMNKPIKI